jgi:hypothetical protein
MSSDRIFVNGYAVALTVRRSTRAKNVIFRVIPGKGLEVVIPKWVALNEVPDFVDRKKGWISRAVETMRRNGLSLEPKKLVLPDKIYFAANNTEYTLVRSLNGRGSLKIVKNASRLHLRGASWTPEEELDSLKKFVRLEAKSFLVPELRKVSRELGLPFEKVAVRSQRSRWGSCSVRKNINLNCKLMFLPFELVRHLFIHELSHTIHLNHSEKFWKLVAAAQPEYKEYEKRLSAGSVYVPDWMNFNF